MLPQNPVGITRKEFLDFNTFLGYPVLSKIAFTFYHKAGVKVTRDVFKFQAKQIAGVELRLVSRGIDPSSDWIHLERDHL